jgi:hypothetical protein
MSRARVVAAGSVALLASGIAPLPAGELIVPTIQERRIAASAYMEWPGQQQSDSDEEESLAPDGGMFDDTVSAYAIAGPASGQGVASQTSMIGGDSIAASGSAGMWFICGSGSYAEASASSELDVTFTLAEPSDYLLHGSIQVEAWGFASVVLSDPGGTIHAVWLMGPSWFPQSASLREGGVLEPGEYRLRAHAGASDGGFSFGERSGSGTYDVTLQLGSGGGPGGVVPDGSGPGTVPLLLEKLPGEMLRMTWGLSCRADDDDYAIYEGSLGDPLASEPVACSTLGQVTHDVTPEGDASWFLVVPHDGLTEGSYGWASGGVERPPSPLACRSQQVADPVCEP